MNGEGYRDPTADETVAKASCFKRYTVYDEKYHKFKLKRNITYRQLTERLAAYENTKLTPKQIETLKRGKEL